MNSRTTVGGFCCSTTARFDSCGLHHKVQQPKPSCTVLPRGWIQTIVTRRRHAVCMCSFSSEDSGDHEHHSSPDDMGDQEDEDGLLQELRQYIGKDTTSQNKQHLDLLWTVSSSAMRKNTDVNFTKECPTCNGTGEIECQYCHGTGALTVGDMLFCDNTGCRQCPVCSGGTLKCSTCKGTGHYASWMIHN